MPNVGVNAIIAGRFFTRVVVLPRLSMAKKGGLAAPPGPAGDRHGGCFPSTRGKAGNTGRSRRMAPEAHRSGTADAAAASGRAGGAAGG